MVKRHRQPEQLQRPSSEPQWSLTRHSRERRQIPAILVGDSISVRPVSTSTAANARMVSGSMGIQVNVVLQKIGAGPAWPPKSQPAMSHMWRARVACPPGRVHVGPNRGDPEK